jgi:hypothetical protein
MIVLPIDVFCAWFGYLNFSESLGILLERELEENPYDGYVSPGVYDN